MVVKSATKKWLMDAGMPELYAHILADDRRPFAWQMYSTSIKAITEMNYEEIADCLHENLKYPVQFSSDFHSELGEILQRVKQYWLQQYEKYMLEDDTNIGLVLNYQVMNDWDIKNYGLRAGYWEFMNWNENPFEAK
jgi:hypothetical protein